ncbi:uncharacterized protein LOC115745754 isoform X4 [Rhodamnia argentea]|uniref:Uncharacterized protein LOC115745754 isoform X4 n=1 Tax=Rhodamnia argentea TaxID=178133 RepID=A0ABM3GS36_9MYRT|nr:uncharacterized protein LOC115745754 isoform X4 [Rhodamnia argentea]
MDIALFSPSSLFADPDDSSSEEQHESETPQSYAERTHRFPGMDLIIREFSFHQLNANLLWPGTFAFAEWLVQHRTWIEGRRIIELGSGTGALAIFLQKSFSLDITTSDYDDLEIEENIAHNCKINGITPVLPHIRHVKQYQKLITSLCSLLKNYKPTDDRTDVKETSQKGSHVRFPRPAFLMSWRRRIRKEDESLFFNGCADAGLEVEHISSRVYCIKPRD